MRDDVEVIGLIGAMEAEVKDVRDLITNAATVTKASMSFTVGELGGARVVLACCGIGKVNAAVATQLLISEFEAATVFNLGTAGAIDEDLDIGDAIVAQDFVYHDFDMMLLVRWFPHIADPIFPVDEKLQEKVYASCSAVPEVQNVRLGRVVSGDRFVSDGKERKAIQEQFQGVCVDMEGSAMAQVCHLNGVPFASCKVISDRADEEASVSFQEFLRTVGKKLAAITVAVLEAYQVH